MSVKSKIFDYEEKLFAQITKLSTTPVTGSARVKTKKALESVRIALEALKFDFETSSFDGKHKLPRIVHVAGTKGKGSVCSFTESILRAHNYRTGLYTSPHLIDVRERVKINGSLISREKMQFYTDDVLNTLQADKRCEGLGFFRFMTVLALYIFGHEKLDVVILEVGIGGLLDSTNIIEKKSVAAVTLLDFDHTDFLGHTMEEIAAQKAGIFNECSKPITLSSQPAIGMQVLKNTANEFSKDLEVVSPDYLDNYNVENLGLEGKHQFENAALATRIGEILLEDHIFKDKVREGLKQTRYYGRGQELKVNETVFFLDGAHTEKSMEASLNWLATKDTSDVALIFNCAHTKDIRTLLKTLVDSDVFFQRVLFVKPNSHKPTSAQVPSLKDLIGVEDTKPLTWQQIEGEVWKFYSIKSQVISSYNVDDAVKYLLQIEQKSVFVTGSFLLVGDVLKALNFNVEGS